jgi:hypothetical protein
MYEKNTLFLSTSDMMDKHFKQMFSLDDKVIFDAIYLLVAIICVNLRRKFFHLLINMNPNQ